MTLLDYGKRSACNSQNLCVELFNNRGYLHKNVNRFDLFKLWFQYGLSIPLSEEPSIFRPVIKFYNQNSLSTILLGYEKELLEQCAMQNGCRKVLFE